MRNFELVIFMHPNPKFKFHLKGIIKQIQQINIFILPILLFALSTPLFPFIPFTCLTDKVFNITKYQRLKIYIVVVVIVLKFVTNINTADHIVTIFSVQYISDQISIVHESKTEHISSPTH